MSYEVMVGNKAAATAVKLARVQVASAYPITPQTTITQYLSEMHANGEWDFDLLASQFEVDKLNYYGLFLDIKDPLKCSSVVKDPKKLFLDLKKPLNKTCPTCGKKIS